MKRSAILLAFLTVCLALGVSAQSGRKLKPAPTPAAAPAAEVQNPEEFSESKPNPTRIISPRQAKKSKNQKPETAKPIADAPPADAPAEDEDTIKVETNLITIPVSVYEKSGVYVSNLRRTDFKVFENGQEQEIAYFGTSEQPFTVVLLIDTSASTSFKIEEIQAAAIAFVDQLKPEDKIMVVSFDSSVRVLADFTNEREKIYKAIRRTSFGGGTLLYEAVETALKRKLSKIDGRKAIVLFTDGVDTSMFGASFESTIEQAEEADAVIYPIYYNTYLASRGIGTGGAMSTPPTIGFPQSRGVPSSADHARGRTYLETLAELTGGKMFRAESTVGGLNAAFEGIAEELRSQYNIGYYPTDAGERGQRRQIKVRVNRPNVAIRARDSYIVGAADTTPKKTGN